MTTAKEAHEALVNAVEGMDEYEYLLDALMLAVLDEFQHSELSYSEFRKRIVGMVK